MALDTYAELHNKVLLRAPAVSSLLARDWISHAFRQVFEKRAWSWLMKAGQFLMPALENAGTVDLTRNSATVAGTGTAFDASMVGRSLTSGLQNPVYTIIAVADPVTLTLDQPWGGPTSLAQRYEIFLAYVTVPSDFHQFISVWDPRFNWQLNLDVTQEELNRYDAQRANQASSSYAVVNYSYSLDPSIVPPLPRYELWPHQKQEYVYPFLYETRPPDLEDAGASLPRYIRGDVLLELALAEAARWPGTEGKDNKYNNMKLAEYHEAKATMMIAELEKQDDNVYEDDISYQTVINMPYAPLPWVDANWMQSHDWAT